jgi:transcription termination/antitermination protein NusA
MMQEGDIMSDPETGLIIRLLTEAVPEIAAGILEIRAVGREPGGRTKVALSSNDPKVDCIGVCVGLRGHRIKNVVDELGGERIDLIRWDDSLQKLIPNALQPAQIDDVFLYPRLRRAIVRVDEDQQSLARGRRGQNARVASQLVGWDIVIMTTDELDAAVERADNEFQSIPFVDEVLARELIEEGMLSYKDVASQTAQDLAELLGVPYREAETIRLFAAERSDEERSE